MSGFQAGFAQVVITPPVGTPMEGYSARQGVSQGVHDDLYARALVLDDGATRAAIVSCDLLGVDRRLVAAARERAESLSGVPAAQIMVAATHTHAGPAGLRWDIDAALAEITARKIAGAIDAAARRLESAVLKVGAATLDGISQNRRQPEWPVETTLRLLLVDRPDTDQPPIAAIINGACHATVLFATNLLLSADYPGAAVQTFRRVTAAPALFLNGACANVNPAWIRQDFAEAERVGAIVGSEAARLAAQLRPLGHGQHVWNIRWDEVLDVPVLAGRLIASPRLSVAAERVGLPLRELAPPDEYDRRLRELDRRLATATEPVARRALMAEITRSRTERMVAARQAGRPAAGHALHPEIQAISLGDGVALLALPGEFFVETARAIRAAADVRDLFVACYANHYVGYVCPPEAFEQGGYEAGVTLVGPDAEPAVREAAVRLLRRVAGGN